MASGSNFHVGRPPHFDGNNYDYWNARMTVHLKAMGGKVWKIISEGFAVLTPDEPTQNDLDNALINDQAMKVLYDALVWVNSTMSRISRLHMRFGTNSWKFMRELKWSKVQSYMCSRASLINL